MTEFSVLRGVERSLMRSTIVQDLERKERAIPVGNGAMSW